MTGMFAGLLTGIAGYAGTLPPPPPPPPLPPVRVAPFITTPVMRDYSQPLPAMPVAPVRATTVQSLPTLFSTADYPTVALRGGEEGTVGFAVLIGRDGRVSQCAVTASSGSASLDSATCSILSRRARYEPARDEAGRTVEDSSHGRVRWALPQVPPLPFVDGRMALIIAIDGGSAVASCRAESNPIVPNGERACATIMTQARTMVAAPAIKASGALANREIVFERGMRVGVADAPRGIGEGPGETRADFVALAVEIDAAGRVTSCAGAEGVESEAKVAVQCREATKRKFVPLDTTVDGRAVRQAVLYSAIYMRPAQ